MILEVYKHPKNDVFKEYYLYALNRESSDDIWYFAYDLKSLVEMYKSKGYRFTKEDDRLGFITELVSRKEYSSIEEIEFEYIQELI